ncbi:MAG: FG-GAP-like repeat-containing protein, partial [Bacteroidota bacterium]
MRNIYTLFFFSCFLITGFFLSAQNPFSFTNSNSKFASVTFKSGNALSVVDMDGDGMDDIARLNNGDDLYYTIQRTGQTFNNIHGLSTGTGNAWSMVVADANNNGIRDVAVGYNGSVKLVTPNSSLTLFPMVTLPGSGFFLQNMNFADINNDGWNDIFGCNDNGASQMWGNNGAGGYPATSNYFSTNNPGSSDNSGNYGSIWTDVNNDGHVDLYIAHCRQSTGSTDGNRLDQLFINDGNNNYILDAAAAPGARGLRNYQQTWTASFEDIDNDGDLDCLLTETDAPSKLLLNNGNGYFTEITNGSGFTLSVTPYQSKMEDLDNDGYVDIIISGDDARVFRNNHNNTFTLINNLFDNNDMLSFATGDLNHDGKIDLYTSYGGVYNNPSSSINDVLWLNTTNNGNHFVTINLQGTQSNRDALGARVEVYGAWGKQIREVRAGESYGTTNTFMCHFGLGTATIVDSVIVRWPRGQVSTLYSRPADQFITIIEGQCSSPDNLITFNGPSVICGGQSVTMSAPAGYSYLWNTGDTTQTLTTSTTGDFTVKVTDTGSGCSSISKMVTVLSLPDETPVITVSGPTRFCQGSSVDLQSSTAASYLWNTGATTQSITATQSGNYFVTTQGSCAAFTSDTTTIAVDASEVTSVVSAATCADNLIPLNLQAVATGDAYWYDDVIGGNLVGAGASFTTPVLNNNTTYYVESRDTISGLEGYVGPVDNNFGTGGLYSGSGRYEIFDVFKACILRTVKVYAGSSGNRTVELRNSAGALLNSATINMPTGESTVTLNFPLVPGTSYRLGWSGSTPNLYRNNSGASYPYTIPNLISVTGSQAGSAFWYAYYNWQVEEQPVTCTSVRVPVIASVNALPSSAITPNGPTSFCQGGTVTLEVASGASYLWSDNSTTQTIAATQSGNYSVTVTNADNCSSSSTEVVTVFTTPDATITSSKPTSICIGDSVVLSAPAGLNYLWSDNTTNQSITVSADGSFKVTVTDNNSCTAESAPVTVTVSNNAVAAVTASGATAFCEG